jgi:hypothetical protein
MSTAASARVPGAPAGQDAEEPLTTKHLHDLGPRLGTLSGARQVRFVRGHADRVQPWERASRRPAWPSVHMGSYGPARSPPGPLATTKLDIERHNVTPEAFGWQVVQTAGGPDFIRVIDNSGM